LFLNHKIQKLTPDQQFYETALLWVPYVRKGVILSCDMEIKLSPRVTGCYESEGTSVYKQEIERFNFYLTSLVSY